MSADVEYKYHIDITYDDLIPSSLDLNVTVFI